MKKIYTFFVICLYLINFGFSQKPTDNGTEKFKQSVVRIVLYDSLVEKEGFFDSYTNIGSGFMISDDGLIITNRNVVEKCILGYIIGVNIHDSSSGFIPFQITYLKPGIEKKIKKITHILHAGHPIPIIQIFNKSKNQITNYIGEVLYMEDSDFGWAILTIKKDDRGNPIRFDPSKLNNFHDRNDAFSFLSIGNSNGSWRGKKLEIFGYSLILPNNDSNSLNLLSSKKLDTLDVFKAYENGVIKTKTKITPSMNGGPIIDDKYNVQGIISTNEYNAGYCYIRFINSLARIKNFDIPLFQKLTKLGLSETSEKTKDSIISGRERSFPNNLLNRIGNDKLVLQKIVQKVISGKVIMNGSFIPRKGVKIEVIIEDTANNIRVISSAISDEYGDWRALLNLQSSTDYRIEKIHIQFISPDPPPSLPIGKIYGHVKNAANLQPISKAIISCSNVGGFADENGYYFMNKIPIGTYIIRCSAKFYHSKEVLVLIKQENITACNFNLDPIAFERIQNLSLPPLKSSSKPDSNKRNGYNYDRLAPQYYIPIVIPWY